MIYFISYLNLLHVKYKDYNIMMYIPSVIQSMDFKSLDYDGTLIVETNIGIEIIPLVTEYSDSKAHKVISALIKKGVKAINVKK